MIVGAALDPRMTPVLHSIRPLIERLVDMNLDDTDQPMKQDLDNTMAGT